MRCSSGRAAIIACVEAITADTKAGPSDRFVVLRKAREPETVTERVTMVRLIAGPDKDDANTCDAYAATFQVVTLYNPSEDIDDRLGDDAERIDRALAASALIARQSDIIDVVRGPLAVSEGALMIAARRDITIQYRISSALL